MTVCFSVFMPIDLSKQDILSFNFRLWFICRVRVEHIFSVSPPVWPTGGLGLLLILLKVTSRPCVLAPFHLTRLLLNSTPDYLIVCWIFPHLPFKELHYFQLPKLVKTNLLSYYSLNRSSPRPLLVALPAQILGPLLPSAQTPTATCATPKVPPPPFPWTPLISFRPGPPLCNRFKCCNAGPTLQRMQQMV